MKVIIGLAFSLALCSCADNLQSAYSDPGQVQVKITSNGNVISNLVFSNYSRTKAFHCRRDRNHTVYIDAQTWVPDGKGGEIQQLFTFFFPLIDNSTKMTQAEWNDQSVQVYGKMGVPPHSLNGAIEGLCRANLLRTDNRLSGDIVCTSIHDTVNDFTYDLQVSNLSCVIETP